MTDQLATNRRVAGAYLEALAAMDLDGLTRLHAEDVVFEILGTTPVSGRFEGRDQCLRDVFGPVVGALAPGTFSFARDAEVVVVDESGAVVLTRSDGETTAGMRYEQVYFLALTIRNDVIVKLEAAYDTAHVHHAIFGDSLEVQRPRPPFRFPPDVGAAVHGDAATKVVLAYYAALAAGDMETFVDLHAPDVAFDLPGSMPISGHFEGLQSCLDGVVQPFLATFDQEQTRFGERFRILCADDRRVAALMRGGGKTASGGTADVIFVQIFTVLDGRIIHLHEQLDTAHIEEACFGNSLSGHRATSSGGLVV